VLNIKEIKRKIVKCFRNKINLKKSVECLRNKEKKVLNVKQIKRI
jgi:hypothetical protein